MKNILKKFTLNSFILILVFILVGCSKGEEVKEHARENKLENSIKEMITNNYISLSSAVGSGNPEIYEFKDDGTFIYHHSDYCVREENEVISFSGTYEIKDNSIVMTYDNEVIAKGGKLEDDIIEGVCLVNYKKEENKNKQTKIFKVKEVKKTGDDDYYMVLDNEENTIYYTIHAILEQK